MLEQEAQTLGLRDSAFASSAIGWPQHLQTLDFMFCLSLLPHFSREALRDQRVCRPGAPDKFPSIPLPGGVPLTGRVVRRQIGYGKGCA